MRVLALVLISASSCTAGAPGAPDAPAAEAENGGTLLLPSCGYAVSTRLNATAPVLVPSGSAPLGADPTPKQVHLGLAADPAHGVVVLWRTNDETTLATTVRYGTASATENSVDGLSFRYASGLGTTGPRVRMHETHMCGLKPDTEYRYQVGGRGQGGAEAWSPEYQFRTAPDVGADPSAAVTVVVLGDSRGAPADFGTIVAAADKLASPDLILYTGDAVTLGPVQSYWDDFFDAARPVVSHVPVLFAHGNHEMNALAYYSMNALPGNESYYGIDFGPMHLTVLNDTPEDPAEIAGVQRDFLAADLAAHAAAPWRLLVHHQAMFSSAVNHGSNLTLRAAWEPVVDEQGVDLVLAGHDHDYERTHPLRAAQVVDKGTVFVVTGGAGAELYQSGTSPFTVYSESTENFVVLTVRRGTLDARAYRANGTMMDGFTLAK